MIRSQLKVLRWSRMGHRWNLQSPWPRHSDGCAAGNGDTAARQRLHWLGCIAVSATGARTSCTRQPKTESVIVVEDLSVHGMIRNRHLSWSIAAAGVQGHLVRVPANRRPPRWYPSTKTCSACGHGKAEILLAERVFRCEVCGAEIDRDRNAARNLAPRVAGSSPGTRNACGGDGCGWEHGRVKPAPEKQETDCASGREQKAIRRRTVPVGRYGSTCTRSSWLCSGRDPAPVLSPRRIMRVKDTGLPTTAQAFPSGGRSPYSRARKPYRLRGVAPERGTGGSCAGSMFSDPIVTPRS